MAKTLKLNVSFPMTIVVNTESVTALEASRANARILLSVGDGPLKGEAAAFLKLFASEITNEELLEVLMRKGVREIVRKELMRELNNTETAVRVGDIKVAFEAPSVPTRKCELHDDRKGCTSLCKRFTVTQ